MNKQTLASYLKKSDKLIKQAKSIQDEDPELACRLAANQLAEHAKLLDRIT